MCMCICIGICVSTGFDTNSRITESNSILFCPFVLSLISPVGLLSVRLVCLSVLARREAGQDLFAPSINVFYFFYFMQIITLIMLLSTSFASCLSDKTHQCGLSKAEYARLWYPVQFPIDRRCFVPESWHTLFWWLFGSFLVFSMPRSACSNTRSVDRVTSASFLFLGVMLIQIANPNIDLLYLHMLHVPTVYVLFACTQTGRPIIQSKSIHLSW